MVHTLALSAFGLAAGSAALGNRHLVVGGTLMALALVMSLVAVLLDSYRGHTR